MPVVVFDPEPESRVFLRSRRVSSSVVGFAYKFLMERETAPYSGGKVNLDVGATSRMLALAVVIDAMVMRDENNRIAKRTDEYGAMLHPTKTFFGLPGELKRDWKMYRPLELTYGNPEIADTLAEAILKRGYLQTELLEEIATSSSRAISEGIL